MSKLTLFLVLLVTVFTFCYAESEEIPGNTFTNCIATKTLPKRWWQKRRLRRTMCQGFIRKSGFRTIDGTCNNLNPKRLYWGAAITELARLLPPVYVDEREVDAPRGFPGSDEWKEVPPANKVCKKLFHIETANKGSSAHLSTLFMTVGQFLDHDITLTPHGKCAITSCSDNQVWKYPCFPILFDHDGESCTSFARSAPACQGSTKYDDLEPRQQVNLITSFVDGSQIYSANNNHSRALRNLDGSGKLSVTENNLLPLDPAQTKTCTTRGGCSLVGDPRGGENIALLSMHTLFVREHNLIAIELKEINPWWSGEQIYQNARKIVGAMWQKIVFEDYVPLIANLDRYRRYQRRQNPSILNSFSSAAFRYGHSLIPEFFSQLNNNFDNIESSPNGISLQEAFFNRLPINAHGIEPTLLGLVGNNSNNVDTAFCQSVGRRLFVKPGVNKHVDLSALNIQRGRDHGVPTYGAWREVCELPVIDTFEELRAVMQPGAVDAFQQLYKHPADIDLFAAGIAEKHESYFDAKNKKVQLQVGPTFSCIFKQQFTALRDGDRFYYKSKRVFTKSQMEKIEKVTMSSIMCRNLKDLISIQENAFIAGNAEGDKRILCEDITKKINFSLEAWREYKR